MSGWDYIRAFTSDFEHWLACGCFSSNNTFSHNYTSLGEAWHPTKGSHHKQDQLVEEQSKEQLSAGAYKVGRGHGEDDTENSIILSRSTGDRGTLRG